MIATLVRSIAVSLTVFAIELAGVAALDAVGTAAPICFAVVQLVGTLVSFMSNKYWAFGARDTGRGYIEGARSTVVFAGSFVLNIGLPSVGTYVLRLAPAVAFTASQIVVGLSWNFPLNRWWVFDRAPYTRGPSSAECNMTDVVGR